MMIGEGVAVAACGAPVREHARWTDSRFSLRCTGPSSQYYWWRCALAQAHPSSPDSACRRLMCGASVTGPMPSMADLLNPNGFLPVCSIVNRQTPGKGSVRVGRTKQTTLSQEGPIVAVAGVVVRRASFRGFCRRSARSIGAELIVQIAPAQVEVGAFSVHNSSIEYGF